MWLLVFRVTAKQNKVRDHRILNIFKTIRNESVSNDFFYNWNILVPKLSCKILDYNKIEKHVFKRLYLVTSIEYLLINPLWCSNIYLTILFILLFTTNCCTYMYGYIYICILLCYIKHIFYFIICIYIAYNSQIISYDDHICKHIYLFTCMFILLLITLTDNLLWCT